MILRHIILIAISALAITSASAHGHHVMNGKVMVNDEVENVQGRRQITTEADLLMPIVPWEALSADGIAVEACYPRYIKLVGDVDETDFIKGNVLTFPKDDYLSLGCPLPPASAGINEMDEVIFRKIIKAKFFNGGVSVKTSFISGAQVAPKVMVHVGELVSPSARIVESGKRLLELNAVSRVNDIGITAFEEDGSFEIVSGVDLNWGVKATAGVCEFDFDRFPPQASFELRVTAEASASLSGSFSFEKADSGELLNVPILGAGFDKRIFLVGTIRFGLFAKVNYDMNLKATASATASFSGRFEAGQKIEFGIRKFGTSNLGSTGEGGLANIDFTGPEVDVALDVDGYIGIRPAIGAEISLPIIGSANAEVGATFGAKLDINYRDVPFPAVASGATLGSACGTCHAVEGTLDVEGKDFAVKAKVPLLGSREEVIDAVIFDTRVGTACAFATACAVTPSTVAPATVAATTATTVAPTTVVATTATTATTVAPTTVAATTATTVAPATVAATTATTATTVAPTTVAATTATTATTVAPTTVAATTATTVAPTTVAATTATTVAPTTEVVTTTTAVVETPCSAFSVSGTCIPTGDCAAKGSFSQPGLCPGPVDIQCCVPNFGVCMSPTAGSVGSCTKGCGGITEIGLCPGDASITCCFE